VKKGKFHILPVRTIDEGIEVLTGTKEQQAQGWFI
jgi:predicted ATP-dependent protease